MGSYEGRGGGGGGGGGGKKRIVPFINLEGLSEEGDEHSQLLTLPPHQHGMQE